MQGKAFEELFASVKERGQLEPVALQGNTLLEGRNRARRVFRDIFKAEEKSEGQNGGAQ